MANPAELHLVLLPGLDGGSELLADFASACSEFSGISIIDYPNDQVLDYDGLLAHIATKLPDKPFVIVAESFGGYLAYRTALNKSKYLRGVVFVATFLRSPQALLLALSRKLKVTKGMHSKPVKFLLSQRLQLMTGSKNLTEKIVTSIQQTEAETFAKRLECMERLTPPEQSLELPALYIQAQQDKLVAASAVEDFKRFGAGILRVESIPGTHFLLQSEVNPCRELLVEFVQAL